MKANDYPTLPEGVLPRLSPKQHVWVAIEGSPILTVVFGLWFVGVSGTLSQPYIEGTPRSIVLAVTAVFFVVSAVIFWRLLKNGYLEKPRYHAERYFLRRMGVEKPMRFLREHPLHLAAYLELTKDLGEVTTARLTRDGLRMVYMPAMLVFTGPDRHTSGPLILSIMDERKITDTASIAGILDEVEHNPPVLSEGAL